MPTHMPAHPLDALGALGPSRGVIAILFCAAMAAPAAAQRGGGSRPEIVGRVRDSTGAPIADVIVETRGSTTRSAADGAFRLAVPNLDTLTISLRRLGFAPETAFIAAKNGRWDDLLVVMRPLAQVLDPIQINKAVPMRMRGFEERRQKGVGVFITRDQIAEHNTMRPSDALRTQRGIRLVRLRDGTYGVRFTMFGNRPNCTPALWIDGQRARGMELDELTANDIEGIELYDSFSITPFEFSRDADLPCGTIVVWTRVPGK